MAEIHRSLGTPLGNALDDRAARLLPLASDALHKQAVIESLNAAGELPLQPAIRDIHRDHVLFTGDEVTGLIDFARCGSIRRWRMSRGWSAAWLAMTQRCGNLRSMPIRSCGRWVLTSVA